MNKRDNIIKWSIISIFVGLYAMVSIISTIHVIDFFRLSNPNWLAITLAIAFEVGAAASLAAIIILDRTSRWLVWSLFVIITLMQMMGNMYYAYTHLSEYSYWAELFGLSEEEPIFQKRILSIVSGAILPIVALGFIKSLVDYIRPSKPEDPIITNDKPKEPIIDPIEITPNPEPVEENPVIEEPVIEPPVVKSPKKKSTIESMMDNFDMADKMISEIKRNEDEDKYPKELPDNQEPQARVFGGM
jgi:hypothetical protein